jgi:hypothetical protein
VLKRDIEGECVHAYSPRRSDTIKGKSLNASRICITKRVKHHSLNSGGLGERSEGSYRTFSVTSIDGVYMLWIASVKHMWCIESLNTMSRHASVAQTRYVSLLHFFYKFWEFCGKSYAYTELILSGIPVWKIYLGEVLHGCPPSPMR